MKISTQNKILLPLLLLMMTVGGTALFGQVTEQACFGEDFCISINSLRGDVQWQGSSDGVAFTDIANETNDTLCQTATATMHYRAVISTEEGCPAVFSDTILVNVNTLQAFAGNDTTSCPGDSVILGGSPTASGGVPPYNFLWAGGGISQPTIANPAAAPANNEEFIVTVTDQDGCIVRDTSLLDIIPVSTGSDTFGVNNGFYSWMIPPCVDSIFIEAWGAQGAVGGGGIPAPGGMGGYASGSLFVGGLDSILIFVGGASSYNGGGAAGITATATGGRGGGASDVRVGGFALGNRVIVAGGGGGGGGEPGLNGTAGAGGAGGGLTGGNGFQDQSGATFPSTPGMGGSQAAGGIAGTGNLNCGGSGGTGVAGTTGDGGDGGDGAVGNCNSAGGSGGGGGGGYFGGGGGGGAIGDGAPASGGGGGSSFIGGVANGTTTAGVRAGDGQVIITW